MAQYILDNLKTYSDDYGAEFNMGFTTSLEDGRYNLKSRTYVSKLTDSDSVANLSSISSIIERSEIALGNWNYLYAATIGKRIWRINTQSGAVTEAHLINNTNLNYPTLWVDDDNDLYYTRTRYLGKFTTTAVSTDTFTGSGLDDLTTSGTPTSNVYTQFKVAIDGTGTPNTFKWSNDNGATWEATAVAITGAAQTLENGVTITFTGTTGHTLGDYWTFTLGVWNDTFQDFGATTDAITTKRPFIPYDDVCFIGNGNYLAVIDNAGNNFAASAKKLPQGTTVACGASNSNLVLVGGEKFGKGILLLFDGDYSTDNWTNKVYLDNPIIAIKPYQSGWIVYTGASLLYTNGYTTEILSDLPDKKENISPSDYNALFEVFGDRVFFFDTNSSNNYTKKKPGLSVYNIKTKTFDLLPTHNNDYYDAKFYSMYYSATRGFIYTGYDSKGKCTLGYLNPTNVNHTGTFYYISRKLKFPKKVKINQVRLKISLDNKYYYEYPTRSLKLTVAGIGDNKIMWGYGQSGATLSGHTNQIQYDATTWQPYGLDQIEVGDMILILEYENAGESSFVTTIDSSTPSATVLTMEDSLTADTISGSYFNVIPARKFDTKTITDAGEVTFYNNSSLQMTDEFYLLIKGVSTYFPLVIDYAVIEYE